MPAGRSEHRRADRLVGLDVARCLALIGMVSVHVVPGRTPDGQLSLAHTLGAGRSAALFAVLAGVSLALLTGRRHPVRGRERVARSAGIAVRALLIAAIGLLLGVLDSGLAVILTFYGLLFLGGLLFVGLRARALLVLAGVWVLAAPMLSQAVRPLLPPSTFDNPALADLRDPGGLLRELTLTGVYPVLPWLAYLLAGMGVGRLDLRRRGVAAWIAGCGAVLAVGAVTLSNLLLTQGRIVTALAGTAGITPAELLDQLADGLYGTTPTDSWAWLAVVAPHSSTPFDLAHTIGSSLLVIGVALLVVGALNPRWTRVVAVVFGAGTMTLSLYSLHVVLRTPGVPPVDTVSGWPWHVGILVGIGALFVSMGWRGPLEIAVGAASDRTAGLVRGSSR